MARFRSRRFCRRNDFGELRDQVVDVGVESLIAELKVLARDQRLAVGSGSSSARGISAPETSKGITRTSSRCSAAAISRRT